MKKLILAVLLLSIVGFINCPAQNASQVQSSDGVKIIYSATGKGKLALVFVHGWSCDKSYWKEITPSFEPIYRVITIDLAGHGESGLERKDHTVQMFGSDVAEVVNHLGLKKVVLVGHSMGGSVILEAALLLKEKVLGLIGVDTYQSFTDDWTSEQKEKFLQSFKDNFKVTTTEFVKGMFPQGADSLLVSRVAEDMSAAPPEIAISAMRNLFYYDPLPTLAKLQIPIVSINCDMYPLSAENNRKYVRNFSFIMMNGVGHFLMLERPDEFRFKLDEAIRELGR